MKRASKPWYIHGTELRCTPSIGVVKFTGREEGHREILRKAEEALYDCKKAGGNQYKMVEA